MKRITNSLPLSKNYLNLPNFVKKVDIVLFIWIMNEGKEEEMRR